MRKTANGNDMQVEVHFILLLPLTLKAPIKTAADDIHKYFFLAFQRK